MGDEAGATEARHVLYVSRLCRMLGVRAPSLAVARLSLPRPYCRPSWGLGVRDEVKARVGTKSLGDADPFGCLVILQQSCYDAG